MHLFFWLDCFSVFLRYDVNWKDYQHSFIDYSLTFGKQRGVPKCRGCKNSLNDRSKLRIQVKSIFKFPFTHIGHSYFCLNYKCLEQAMEKDHFNNQKKNDKYRYLYYPLFQGTIGVQSDIKEQLQVQLQSQNQLAMVQGIRWVAL